MKRLIFILLLLTLTAGAEYKRVFTVPTPASPTPEPADRVARRIGAEPLVNSDLRAKARAEREAQVRAQAAADFKARTNGWASSEAQAQAQGPVIYPVLLRAFEVEREAKMRAEREFPMRVERERVEMLREKERLAFAFRVMVTVGLLLFAGWIVRRFTTNKTES